MDDFSESDGNDATSSSGVVMDAQQHIMTKHEWDYTIGIDSIEWNKHSNARKRSALERTHVLSLMNKINKKVFQITSKTLIYAM